MFIFDLYPQLKFFTKLNKKVILQISRYFADRFYNSKIYLNQESVLIDLNLLVGVGGWIFHSLY